MKVDPILLEVMRNAIYSISDEMILKAAHVAGVDLFVNRMPRGYDTQVGEHGAGLSNNPYREWVETYAGDEYQGVVRSAIEQLDRVAERRVGALTPESPRWDSLATTFRAATRLEAGFWEMGLNP